MTLHGEVLQGLRWSRRTRTVSCLFVAVVLVCALWVPAARAADPQQMYKDGIEALYNLDFIEAESTFDELTRSYPENPDYWTGLASVAWLKILQEQQKLNMESFSGKGTFGTSDSKEELSAMKEASLRDNIDRAIKAADARLKKNPNDIQALYSKGAANATLASFEGTIKRSYLTAARKAKAARDLHRDVLKLDPDFHDAEMTIGIYNYVVASAPRWARFTILFALGISGDGKDEGIRQLESAVRNGKRVVTDAKSLLVVVYTREKRYEEALKLDSDLHNAYPRNFMYELSMASIQGKMNQWDVATETYQKILRKIRSETDGYEKLRAEKVLMDLGNSQIQSGHAGESLEPFGLVVVSPDATPNEKASAHIWMGKVYDSSNRRPLALEHYQAVRNLDCDKRLKDEARKFERKPFK